jgi:hypothetical protein
MILSKDEAVCLIVGLAKNNNISSKTKLNKLTAKLNQFLIPVDINFSLNKYGSFNAELSNLKDNQCIEQYEYEWYNKKMVGFKFKNPNGEHIFKQAIKKLGEIMTSAEIQHLREEFYELSQISPSELSEDEHKKLLVDVDDRDQLINRINLVVCEMNDLYSDINKLNDETLEEIRLGALIEFCYYLSKFLKEVRFKDIEHRGYGFEDHMFDYYSLRLLEEYAPIIRKELSSKVKNKILINKLYHYFIYYPKDRYPFSFENKDLFKIIAK